MPSDPAAGEPSFHREPVRPKGIVFLVAGVIGLSGTWMFVDDWSARIIASVVFGVFVAAGMAAVFFGGYHRSWFADGYVHWAYPSRFFGRAGCCRIADIVEFQLARPGDPESSESYWLLLLDGTRHKVGTECIGDGKAFYRVLRKQNKNIVFIDGYESELRATARKQQSERT